MPSGLNQPSSDIEPIVGIQFGIFSPEEIERRSVVEITNAGTFDGSEPRIGGLFDPRMGVLDNGKTCRSCGQTNHNCPGHFGHYKLARPVYFIQFFETIMKVMNCICIRCSKLLIDKELNKNILKKKGEIRWRAVQTLCANIKRCGQDTEDGCGALKPNRYVREAIARIVAEWDNIDSTPDAKKQRQVLECEYVLRLFRRITDEDVDFMGFNRYWCRPDWMICSVLPIPPPQVRPSVIQDNNQRSEDDLTHKLFEIIQTNNTVQDKINNNAAKNIIDDQYAVLQYHVATLVDNQIPGVAPSAQRSGRPLKSIQQRLGSKEGRIRYNIQGKRVEFSGRSVITPDPNISIEEIGVPKKIAMNLTVPERVTTYNRNQMYKLIQNGADVYPGAKTIIRKDGRMISLKHVNTKEIVLQLGDIVNRHLMDGDPILFNRQPTLHRMSMMGHKVKVLPYNTFRLNVSVVTPYNADFDGDEMNMHCPQSYEASIELAEIAAVSKQIITPRHAKPVIGIVQDTLIGSYRITQPNVDFTRREFMNMMMWNKHFTGVLPEPSSKNGRIERYDGKQVISQILPPLNMEMGNSRYDDEKVEDNFVKIKEGYIHQGIFDKDVFSKPSKGIIHTIFKDYGPKETVHFIDCMQNTIEQFLIYNGFSVGISDLIADEKTKNDMNDKIRDRKAEVETIILQLHLDLFTNNTGKTNKQEFEDRVFSALNKATEESGKIGLGSLAAENRLVSMVRAGSKGSLINIAQMLACVGQQAPEGRRIPLGFNDRTLPHYKKYDDGAEARGFVESSFIKGLSPQEFFFHAMSGREGLIDTAVKTADTGYIQRQLVKAMEDCVTQNDGSVRDAKMNIVQFHYGEDGTNSTMIESQSLALGKFSIDELKKEYGMVGVNVQEMLSVDRGNDAELMAEYVTQVLNDQKIMVENVNKFKGVENSTSVYSPVNIERAMKNIKTSFKLDAVKTKTTDLTPSHILSSIKKVLQKTQPYNSVWGALLRFHLAPHKLIARDRYTVKAFDTLCEVLVVKNYQSWAQPGEQVGIIAAQSIGEPSTQMTVIRDAIVVINGKTEKIVEKIGDFVDRILEKESDKVVTIGPDSVVLDLTDDYNIIGVSNDEKTSWRRISQVSRHPANGGMVEITTKSGRKTTATLTHSFLTRSTNGVVPILGSELKVGTRVPIARTIPEVPNALYEIKEGNTSFNLTKEFGWLCGIYLADGSLSGNTTRICKIHPRVEEKLREISTKYGWEITTRNYNGEYGIGKDTNIYSEDLKNFLMKHFSTGSYGKTVDAAIYHANNAFISGLLGGYFDGDGNINVERQQIRVGSRSKDLIHHIARLLSYCGIFGAFGEETSVRIPDKILYTYQVLKKYAAQFKEVIGLELNEKAAGLDAIITYMERDGKHDTKELYDKIPEVGDVIAETGKLIGMPGHSRNYGRWAKKESVGRLTLQGYIQDFEEYHSKDQRVLSNIEILRAAAYCDVLWDEITELKYLDDPKTYVYDFTVPGNDSFMVDDNILIHNTLNTFHLAGVASKSNVTRGVPRLKELLKVTQNPKAISLTIPLKKQFRDSIDKAREVAQDLELTLLKDIVTKTAIYFDPTETTVIKEDKEIIDFFNIFESQQAEDDKWSKWLLRLEFDHDAMFKKNITMDDVAFALEQKFSSEIKKTYSDYNSDKLIMRIRLAKDKKDPNADDILNLKKMQNRFLNLIIIRGIQGIKSVSYRKDTNYYELVNGKYEQITQYILDTDGSNFLEIMNHPFVYGNGVLSSHVHDIYENLGIEAARITLLNEITNLFADAGGVDFRHLGLLCDWMTRVGKLLSVDRYGINKQDIGPLAKASFEETEKILLKAALFGEVDPITGVSANIMTGQPIRGGTGFSEILLDEAALMRLQEGLPPVEEGEEEYVPTEENIEEELGEDMNTKCSTANLKLNVALPQGSEMIEEPDVELTILE